MPGDAGRVRLLAAVMEETFETFFALRKAGQRIGGVTDKGAGWWGLLRLIGESPRTVPQLAALRGVSRQYIQAVVDEMARQKLVVFRDNPAHARSPLLALTPRGERRRDELTVAAMRLLAQIAPGFRAGELETAREVLSRFRVALARGGERNQKVTGGL